MTGFRSRSVGPLLLVVAAAVSCGGGNRQLQTVSLQPAQADAKNFPRGQVQFTATGTFSHPPSPVPLTSKDVTWCVGELTNVANPTAGVCVGNIATVATVDQNGLAQCTGAPFPGTEYILAGTPLPSMNPDGPTQLKVFGAATLTCP